MEVTDDKIVIPLIKNFKYIVILVESVLHSWNIPHTKIFVFYETNVRDDIYKTDADTDQYL